MYKEQVLPPPKNTVIKEVSGGTSSSESQLPRHNEHIGYRPDIDGLRAIAILSVVIYHAFPSRLSGGFVGVDIFFVISGFLISSILFKSLHRGSFSFIEFYSHRIKRIFPSMILVMVATYAFGWFALLPDEFKQLGKHIAAGAGFVQNFVLWKESGYFDTASELKPLLHLWSLSIEEQFYLFFPLLICVAWRLGLNVLMVIAALAMTSFGLNIMEVGNDASSAFYLPQTRIWELLAGSILAYLQFFKKGVTVNFIKHWVFQSVAIRRLPLPTNCKPILNNLIAMVGLFIIVSSLFFIGKDQQFPGWIALFPVASAFLLILAGPATWVNRKILANRLMVFVGVISYPLYLWHWPILFFARTIASETPTREIRMAAIALSIMLAWLTYKLVESPIRFGQKTWIKTAIPVMMLLLIAFAGYNTFERNGLGFRVKDRENFVNYFENNPPSLNYSKHNGMLEKYREQCNFYDLKGWMNGRPTLTPRDSIDPACFTPSGKTSIFLWGDSHAEQLYYGLHETLPKDISILQVASSGCPAQVVEKLNNEPDYCQKSNKFATDTIRKYSPKIVLIAQVKGHDEINNFREIIKFLKSAGVEQIIIVGPVPRWEPFLYKLIVQKFWLHTPRRTFHNIIPEPLNTDSALKKRYENTNAVQYVSMTDLFCNQEGCLTYLGDDRRTGLVTFDYGHLTAKASEYAAKNLLAPIILKDLGR